MLRSVAIAVALTSAAVGAAEAYSFGSTTVAYDSKNRGAGKGEFYRVGTQTARLKPTVRDLLKDDARAYIEGRVSRANDDMIIAAKVQSGRRADGGTAWATLATKDKNAGTNIQGGLSSVRVCMDRSWSFDPCKVSKSNVRF